MIESRDKETGVRIIIHFVILMGYVLLDVMGSHVTMGTLVAGISMDQLGLSLAVHQVSKWKNLLKRLVSLQQHNIIRSRLTNVQNVPQFFRLLTALIKDWAVFGQVKMMMCTQCVSSQQH